MKKILSLLLIATMLVAACALPSCMNKQGQAEAEEPVVTVESFITALENTSALFDAGWEMPELPTFDNGVDISLKGDISYTLGVAFDADLHLSGKTPDDLFVGLKLNSLNVADTVMLKNTALYATFDKVAASIGNVSSAIFGMKYTELLEVITKLTGKAPDAETVATVTSILDTVAQVKLALTEAMSSVNIPDVSVEVPTLTEEQQKFLTALVVSKVVFNGAKDGDALKHELSLSFEAAIATVKEFIAELRKAEDWQKFFTEFEKNIPTLKELGIETEATTVEGLVDELVKQFTDESGYALSDLTVTLSAKSVKRASDSKDYLTNLSVNLKLKGTAILAATAEFDIEGRASADVEILLNEEDGSSDSKIKMTVEKANTVPAVDKYEITASLYEADENGKFEVISDIEFALETNIEDGGFKIVFTTVEDGEAETFTLGGNLLLSKSDITFKLNAIGLSSIGVTLDPKFQMVIKPAQNPTFPEYKDIKDITSAELAEYVKFITDIAKIIKDNT